MQCVTPPNWACASPTCVVLPAGGGAYSDGGSRGPSPVKPRPSFGLASLFGGKSKSKSKAAAAAAQQAQAQQLQPSAHQFGGGGGEAGSSDDEADLALQVSSSRAARLDDDPEAV